MDYKLPDGYQPYRELDFCNNLLSGVGVPLLFNRIPVLLIGKGDLPRVWLYGPTDPRGTNWNQVVIDNRSINPIVQVVLQPESGSVSLKIEKSEVLHITVISPDKAKVTKLDFRPIGIDIHGTESELNIGGTWLIQNYFSNSTVAFATASAQ